MNWWKAAAEEIITGTNKTISNLDERQVEKLIALVLEAKGKKIFVDGMGRSGFVGRAFALRLMNLGFNVYFIGETITPAAGPGDLLIAISGTGETKMVVTAGMAAKEIGAKTVAITSIRALLLPKLLTCLDYGWKNKDGLASRGGLFDAANHGREGIHNSARKHVREQLHDISRWTCS